jgi:hypothetical protein
MAENRVYDTLHFHVTDMLLHSNSVSFQKQTVSLLIEVSDILLKQILLSSSFLTKFYFWLVLFLWMPYY